MEEMTKFLNLTKSTKRPIIKKNNENLATL